MDKPRGRLAAASITFELPATERQRREFRSKARVSRDNVSAASFAISGRKRRLVGYLALLQKAESQTGKLERRLVVRARRLDQQGPRRRNRTGCRMPARFIDRQLRAGVAFSVARGMDSSTDHKKPSEAIPQPTATHRYGLEL